MQGIVGLSVFIFVSIEVWLRRANRMQGKVRRYELVLAFQTAVLLVSKEYGQAFVQGIE